MEADEEMQRVPYCPSGMYKFRNTKPLYCPFTAPKIGLHFHYCPISFNCGDT